MKVFKYEINLREDASERDVYELKLSLGAKILSAGTRKSNHITIWALVYGGVSEEVRRFLIVGTGNLIKVELERLKFIGSVFDGPFVWHVFEIVEEV